MGKKDNKISSIIAEGCGGTEKFGLVSAPKKPGPAVLVVAFCVWLWP